MFVLEDVNAHRAILESSSRLQDIVLHVDERVGRTAFIEATLLTAEPCESYPTSTQMTC
jgi:hypothetical protein